MNDIKNYFLNRQIFKLQEHKKDLEESGDLSPEIYEIDELIKETELMKYDME